MHYESSNQLESIARSLFFVVGVPRSGTTLLQAMLSSHPNISIPPETEFFLYFNSENNNLAARVTDEQIDKYLNSQAWREQNLDETVFRDVITNTDRSPRSIFLTLMKLSAAQASDNNKLRIGEKSPHHCRHVLRIFDMFPDAKFIHIHRDPRDVAASRIKLKWSQNASYLSVAREWARIMADHFRLELKLRDKGCYFTVRYETLVDSPESEIRRVCDFLNETYNPAMLDFYKRNNAGFSDRETEWKGGTMKPLNPASIGRYKEDLTLRQIAGIQKITLNIMPQLGYQPDPIKYKPAWKILDMGNRFQDISKKLARSISKRVQVL